MSRRGRGWGLWVGWTLAVAAVLGLEIGLLHERIAADLALVLEAGGGGPAEPVATLPGLPAAGAPAEAGPVRALDLRVLPGCTPGGQCRVRIQVLVAPGGAATVDWALRADDLCARTGSTVGTGTLALPPGADRADTVVNVVPPAGPASALTALTSAPAVVASWSVRVPAAGSCGP